MGRFCVKKRHFRAKMVLSMANILAIVGCAGIVQRRAGGLQFRGGEDENDNDNEKR